MNNDEEVPVRSPIDVETAPIASTQDEDDYSTLLAIQKDINETMTELKSVNAFDLTEGELTIKEQIAAYRKAVELIEPLQVLINSTVDDVKLKWKDRQ